MNELMQRGGGAVGFQVLQRARGRGAGKRLKKNDRKGEAKHVRMKKKLLH